MRPMESEKWLNAEAVTRKAIKLKPGDDLEMLEHEGRITILKKREGQSRGALKHLLADPQASDTESRDDVIVARRSGSTPRRTAA